MSVFKKRVGFSTGALERGDYKSALDWLLKQNHKSVELSALRIDELQPLVNDLDRLPLHGFDYISFHAPSSFRADQEEMVVHILETVYRRGWNIIVHPDVIRKHSLWTKFGSNLLIENMDRRKPLGRTVDELEMMFKKLPHARLCLDMAHARQIDTTMLLLSDLIDRFKEKIGEIHISELDSACAHQPMSWAAVNDYKECILDKLKDLDIPTIIESMLDGKRRDQRKVEFELTLTAIGIKTIQHKQDERCLSATVGTNKISQQKPVVRRPINVRSKLKPH